MHFDAHSEQLTGHHDFSWKSLFFLAKYKFQKMTFKIFDKNSYSRPFQPFNGQKPFENLFVQLWLGVKIA